MKKFLLLIGVAAMMAACNDDDIYVFDSPVVDDPSLSGGIDANTVSALTFSWQAVDGVNQYGYELADPDGKVQREGVTSETTIIFTKLSASTTYTLTVEAYGANGVNTRRFSMTGTTGDIISLSAPTGFTQTQEKGKITITWNEVANADHYFYTVTDAAGESIAEDTTDNNTISLSGLAIGDYTLTVYATSDDETYSQSGTASYLFSRNREVTSTKEGTYESYLYGSWPCTMDICDDGSYVIHNFMQVEDYDLEFSIGDDNAVQYLNYYDEYGQYRYVATGLEDAYYIAFYESVDYSYYYHSEEEGSYVMLCAYYPGDDAGGYDYFRWDVPTHDEPQGDWNYRTTGRVCKYTADDWGENMVPECDVIVESYDDYVIIRSLAGVEGYDLQVNYSADNDWVVTSITPYIDGEDQGTTTTGYAYVYTGLEDWYCFMPYVGVNYCYAYDNGSDEGYVLLSAYFYDREDNMVWGSYYVEWPTDGGNTEPDEPSGPETVTGQVCKYTGDDWGENMVPDCSVNVELYDGYVIVRSVAGVEGYDLKVEYDEETLVTALTPIIDGEEDERVTTGYAYVYTGLEDWYCFMPYIGAGYCYTYVGSDSGYVLLSSYFYDVDGNSVWGSYYVEW